MKKLLPSARGVPAIDPELMKSFMAGLAVTAISAGLVFYVVYDREAPRTTDAAVDAARASMNQVGSELGRLHAQPKLPSLGIQWIALNSRVHSGCDLVIDPVVFAPGNPPSEGHYQGNATAWHGRIQGKPMQALACARIMATEFPLVIGSISQQPEATTILFSLLGSNDRPL